ncbi:MAG: spore germination protein [Firmicutes bacterium]|nr:spore germination protein [Bacillota bacterium]
MAAPRRGGTWSEESQKLVAALDRLLATLGDRYRPDLREVETRLRRGIGRSPDVLIRRLAVPAVAPDYALLVCIDGLVDTRMVDQDIAAPLLVTHQPPAAWGEAVFTPSHIRRMAHWSAILQALAAGNTLVMAPDLPFVWVVDTGRYRQRSVQRPLTEHSVRGPEDSFNEVLLSQMNQIRQRLHEPRLRFSPVRIGRLQHTQVAVAYLEGLTNPALVRTVLTRLRAVDIAGHADATQIAGLIRDHPRSIFPTIRATERVDIAVRRLLEGKVVILVDGDPFVLIAPAPLADFYRTAMDYASTWADTAVVRIIRLGGWAIGVYLPALYVALTEVNPSLVSTSLFVLTAGNNVGLSLPPLGQVVFMVFILEVLREAALRLPQPLSTTIGTVGAIVVGTAVVKAAYVSPQVIVIMTLTALSFFSAPLYELTGTWRLIGFGMLGAAAFLGILGMVLFTMAFIGVISGMTSFGVPYFEPWAPFRGRDWLDVLWRVPWSSFRTRPTASRPRRVVLSRGRAPAARPHLRRERRP